MQCPHSQRRTKCIFSPICLPLFQIDLWFGSLKIKKFFVTFVTGWVQRYGHLGLVTFLQWDWSPWAIPSLLFLFLSQVLPGHLLFPFMGCFGTRSSHFELLFMTFILFFLFYFISFLFIFIVRLFFVWGALTPLQYHGSARHNLHFLTFSTSHHTPNLGFWPMFEIYLYNIWKRVTGNI